MNIIDKITDKNIKQFLTQWYGGYDNDLECVRVSKDNTHFFTKHKDGYHFVKCFTDKNSIVCVYNNELEITFIGENVCDIELETFKKFIEEVKNF